MQHCYKIYKTAIEAEKKSNVIELLRFVADERVLQWMPEFLADSNPNVQFWSIGILDQLLLQHPIEKEDMQSIIQLA